MNRLVAALRSFWCSLPHQLQAALVAFASGFMAAGAHAYEDAGFHLSWGELHHLLPTLLAAGVASARVFYMLPSKPAAKAPDPAPAAAEAPKEPPVVQS